MIVWWGLLDEQMFVECGDARYGPFDPVGGAVPLHRYRKHRKSKREQRSDAVDTLAAKLQLPRSALSGETDIRWTGPVLDSSRSGVVARPFSGPDPFHELAFPTNLAARKAIADEVRLPLGKLSADDRAFITDLLGRTLGKPEVMAAVRARFPRGQSVTRAQS